MRSRLLALALAAVLWLPTVHLFFARSPEAVAASLERRQADLWSGRRGEARMSGKQPSPLRTSNPEWELMHRMFDVLAFANVALARPSERASMLRLIDDILASTLSDERTHGQLYFLLPYARRARFQDSAGRSLFVDGELALMLAARQLVDATDEWAAVADKRVARVVAQLERAPLQLAESYPDEGWMFCNVVALVAVRLHDGLSGQDHRDLERRVLASARAHLVDPTTGLLVSSFSYRGQVKDGPEGSTLWLVAPFLELLDPVFARDQYRRAKHELGRRALGFAWAREWPRSWPGGDDVDSGPTVPIVDANAGSSGLALVAARAFGDEEFWRGLLASLELGGFPIDSWGQRRYAAGNDLADAVFLYALVQGPLWQRARALGVTP
jgi:hypothetical protein